MLSLGSGPILEASEDSATSEGSAPAVPQPTDLPGTITTPLCLRFAAVSVITCLQTVLSWQDGGILTSAEAIYIPTRVRGEAAVCSVAVTRRRHRLLLRLSLQVSSNCRFFDQIISSVLSVVFEIMKTSIRSAPALLQPIQMLYMYLLMPRAAVIRIRLPFECLVYVVVGHRRHLCELCENSESGYVENEIYFHNTHTDEHGTCMACATIN